MNRRNFIASIVAAVAMAPQLLRFKAELPIVHFDGMEGPQICLEDFRFGFQWYRENLEGGRFPVGMGETYTVTKADIGSLVSCTTTVT